MNLKVLKYIYIYIWKSDFDIRNIRSRSDFFGVKSEKRKN